MTTTTRATRRTASPQEAAAVREAQPRVTADTARSAAGPVRLRPAVHVATVPEGLLVVGWQSRVLVSGGVSLHRLWAAIGPHLNHGVEVDVLVGALPEVAQPTVRQLIERLSETGMLVPVRRALDAGDDRPAGHSPSIRRLLDFLDSAADSPQAAWSAIRTATVLVRGSDAVAERTAVLLRDHGVGCVRVTDTDVARAVADAAAPGDQADHGALLGPDREDHAERPTLAVVTDGTRTRPDTPTVRVLSLGDRALILPPAPSPSTDDLLGELGQRGGPTTLAPTPLTVALLAAGQAVVQAIYALTGIVTEFDGKLISIQADRLRISHHPLWATAELTGTPVLLDDRTTDDPELLVDLTDPLTGLLSEALPDSWPQNPFAVAVTGSEVVLGAAVTGAAARYRAALESARGLVAGQHPVPAGAVIAAGADARQFVVDAMTRLISRGLDGQLLQTGTGPDLDDPDVDVRAARHRLTTVLGDHTLTVQHLRLRHDPDLLAVAAVRDHTGALRAMALGVDPAQALVRAVDHAAARAQCGDRGEVVPQLGIVADLPEEARPWAGELDRLSRAVTGVPLAQLDMGRVNDEHPLGRLGILGWLATPGVTS